MQWSGGGGGREGLIGGRGEGKSLDHLYTQMSRSKFHEHWLECGGDLVCPEYFYGNLNMLVPKRSV